MRRLLVFSFFLSLALGAGVPLADTGATCLACATDSLKKVCTTQVN